MRRRVLSTLEIGGRSPPPPTASAHHPPPPPLGATFLGASELPISSEPTVPARCAPGRIWGRPLLPQILCGRRSGTIARVSRMPGARLRPSGWLWVRHWRKGCSGTGERVAPWAQGRTHPCHSRHAGYVASGAARAARRPEHCASRGAEAARPSGCSTGAPEDPQRLRTEFGASRAESWGPSLSAPSEAAPLSP